MNIRTLIQWGVLFLFIFISCDDKKDPNFEITIDPAEHQFGKVEINERASQKVRIKNTENSSETFIGELTIDSSPISFTMDFNGVLTLAKNESKEIYITFRPSDAQQYTGKLVVKNEYTLKEMYLYGEGASPVSFTIDKTKLEFGLVEGGESKDLELSITNSQSSGFDAEIDLNIAAGDFSIVGGNTNYSIAPGKIETVVIRYTPTISSSSKSLRITHNSTIRPSPTDIPLSGIMDESDDIQTSVTDGWTQFVSGNYNDSRQSFQNAMNKGRVHTAYDSLYGEAMHGRGWAILFGRSGTNYGESAFIDFTNVISDYGNKVSSKSALDCLAGKAISGALAGGSNIVYNAVVSAAKSLLDQNSAYQFSYKSSVDHKDVRMAKIQAHYYLGEYSEAAIEMDVLDPSNSPHSSDPGVLLSAIQALAGSL